MTKQPPSLWSDRSRSAGVTLWLLVATLCGCSESAPAESKPPQVDTTPNSSCPAHRLGPAGECCPDGTFLHPEQGGCVAVGPPSCAAHLLSAEACTPRWCLDHLDVNDTPCTSGQPGCLPRGRPCSAQELAAGVGCLAGTWPASDGACVPAGLPTDQLDDKGRPPPLAPLPALSALPALLQTRFCYDADSTQVRLCEPADKSCGPAMMPDPLKPADCMPVGVPWSCPPGFIQDGAGSKPDRPRCVPDPADCAAAKWPDVKPGAGVFFVAAGASPGGDGSQDKPHSTLADGVNAAKGFGSGATVALAAGTYTGVIETATPMTISGLCAAKVILQAPVGKTALKVVGVVKPGQVKLTDITVVGSYLGLIAGPGPEVVLQRIWIRQAHAFGAVATNAGAFLRLGPAVIEGLKTQADGSAFALVARKSAKMRVTDVYVQGAAGNGAMVDGAGSHMELVRTRISSVKPWPGDTGKTASLLITPKAQAVLRSTRLDRGLGVGVIVGGGKALLQATGVIIDRHGPPDMAMAPGAGVLAAEGGVVQLRGVRMSLGHGNGLRLSGPDSTAVMEGLIFDGIDFGMAKVDQGGSIVLQSGAKATLHSGRISGARTAGISVVGEDTKLTAVGLVVDGTRAHVANGRMGVGLNMVASAQATVSDVRLSGNRGAGLALFGQSQCEVQDLVVDGTKAILADGVGGVGVVAYAGCTLKIHGARISGNRVTGMLAVGEGSALLAENVLVDGTLTQTGANAPGGLGYGAEIYQGAHAVLLGCRFSGNHTAGLVIEGSGTRVSAMGLLIDATQARDKDNAMGVGIFANRSAALDMAGSRLTDNRVSGLMVAAMNASGYTAGGLGARVHAAGTVIEDTRPDLTESEPGEASLAHFGVGVLAAPNVRDTHLTACLLQRNHAAGVVLDHAGGTVTNTVIRQTLPEDFKGIRNSEGDPVPAATLADGLVMLHAQKLVVGRCLIRDHQRAAILVSGAGQSEIEATLATGSHFGMVLTNEADPKLKHNLLIDNDSNLAGEGAVVAPAPPLVQTLNEAKGTTGADD